MILVSILGDFDSNILPLFFHYSEDISTHVLLFDKHRQDSERAASIQRGLKRFCLEYVYDPLLLEIEFDEDSQESIENVLERIIKLSNNKKIMLNASDGMVSTLALMKDRVLELDGVILAYDRFDNSCNVVSKAGMKKESIAGMDIHQHLLLKNIDYETIDPDDIETRSSVVKELMSDSQRFMNFRDALLKKKPLSGFSDIEEKLLSISKRDDQFFINGAIFEEYLYLLLKDIGFDDISVGTKVRYLPNDANSFQNEIDVLVMKENHMHIIECKFRRFIEDTEPLIYKYDSVIDMLDNDGKSMIVVLGSADTKVTKQNHHKMLFRHGTRRRARFNDIYLYNSEKLDEVHFINEVKIFFDL